MEELCYLTRQCPSITNMRNKRNFVKYNILSSSSSSCTWRGSNSKWQCRE